MYLPIIVFDQYRQTKAGKTCCMHHALAHEAPTGSMIVDVVEHHEDGTKIQRFLLRQKEIV